MFRNDRFAALKGFAVLLAAALLLVLLAAACDGGGGGGDTPQAGETPAAGETPTASETPTADNTPAEGETPAAADGEGLQELEALAGEAAGGVTGKVTYSIKTETDGEKTEQELVLVQRPPDSRIEIATTEGGEESRVIAISAGGSYYYCISAAGQAYCMPSDANETEGATAAFDAFFSTPQELVTDSEDVDIAETSHRSIAGVDATCFKVNSTLSDIGESEICFSDGGIMLYLNSETAGQTLTFEATSVSTDVTDADFEPPYDITDLSGLVPEQ